MSRGKAAEDRGLGLRHAHTLPALIEFATGADMSQLEIFHFDDDRPNFESMSRQNGFKHWRASDLMEALGYGTMQPILKAVNNAISACAQLEIQIPENFEQTTAEDGGRDWKLSRFACYLTVMNGDPKNRRVAEAQAYFVTIAGELCT